MCVESAASSGIQSFCNENFIEMAFLCNFGTTARAGAFVFLVCKAQNLFFRTKTYILPKNSTFILFCDNLMVREWEVHAQSARGEHRLGQAFRLLRRGLQLHGAESARVLGWPSTAGAREHPLLPGTFVQREGNGGSSPSSSFFSV